MIEKQACRNVARRMFAQARDRSRQTFAYREAAATRAGMRMDCWAVKHEINLLRQLSPEADDIEQQGDAS